MSKVECVLGNVWEIIKVLLRILINIRFVLTKRYRKKNLESKNVLILANGPSLSHIDINRIIDKNTDIICMNYFPCKDDRFFQLKPRFLCILDPSILNKTDNNRINLQNKKLRDTLEKIDWNLDIIKPWNMNIDIKNKRVGYINLSIIPYHCKLFRKTLYSHNIATVGFQNVAIGALFFAVISGAKTIYLAGIDNSEFKNYEINEKNEVYLDVEHHYGKERIRMECIPCGGFTNQLKLYYKMFEQYYYLADYIKANTNTKVINLNPNSFVDVFEKNMDYYS